MRKLLLIGLLAILCLSVKAQNKDTIGLNVPIVDGRIVYESVIDAPTKSKNDLYQNAQQWFVDYFKSSKDVIQNQDKEEGLVVGKGMIDFSSKVSLGMTAISHDKLTIKIICKDNKYKYSIYDMVIYPPNMSEAYAVPLGDVYGKLLGIVKLATTKGIAKRVMESNDTEIKKLIMSLKQAMVKKIEVF